MKKLWTFLCNRTLLWLKYNQENICEYILRSAFFIKFESDTLNLISLYYIFYFILIGSVFECIWLNIKSTCQLRSNYKDVNAVNRDTATLPCIIIVLFLLSVCLSVLLLFFLILFVYLAFLRPHSSLSISVRSSF